MLGTRSPSEVIELVKQPLMGLPACIVGSAVAAEAHGKPLGLAADVDVFCASSTALIRAATLLEERIGATITPRHVRPFERWLNSEMGTWKNHSLKMVHTETTTFGIEVSTEMNLVYKTVNKHPLDSLARVLESFDFGLLATGYDLRDGQYRDMRPFFFPGLNPGAALPMIPIRREAWVRGLFSKYHLTRQCGRYAKYHSYGYDLSQVKQDMVTGYLNYALYQRDRGGLDFDGDNREKLAELAEETAIRIEMDSIDELLAADAVLPVTDALDAVMQDSDA